MKRLAASLLLSLVVAAGTAGAETADVIVLLDTSESMFSYVDPVVNYVIDSVVEDYIRLGDSFHILTFSDAAQLELSQEVKSNADLRAIVTRLYLLYAFGANTDLASAIDYLEQYASDLGDSSLKNIIIITDAIHNPPAASHYAKMPPPEIEAGIRESIKAMKAKGWRVSFIKVPFKAGTSDGSQGQAEKGEYTDFSKALSEELGAAATDFDASNPDSMTESAMGLISATFPGNLGKRNSRFSLPLRLRNSTNADARLELISCISEEYGEVLEEKAFLRLGEGKTGILRARLRMPESMKDGDVSLPVRFVFSGSTRIVPGSGTLSFTLSRNAVATFFSAMTPKFILLILIVLAFIAICVIVAVILKQSAPKTAIAGLGRKPDDEEKALKSSMGINSVSAYVPPSRYTEGYAAKATGPAAKAERLFRSKDGTAGAQASLASAKAAERISRAADGSKAPASSPFSFAADAAEAKKREEEARKQRQIEAEAEIKGRKSADAAIRSLQVRKEGEVRLEFKIDEQTSLVGFRNIHSLKSGTRMSVGGSRNADFFVFVVRVPSRLADVYFDGETLNFIPVRKDYFPGMDEVLRDCIDEPIKCVTPTGYAMTMKFTRWENPAIKFNRLLDLIDIVGSRR
jgi:hypothetical protein